MKTLRLALRPFLVSLQRTKNRLFAPDLLLYTNTAITVAMSISGDLMQQHYQAIKKPKAPDWDKRRTTHMALAGFVIGPFAHYWYVFLDRLLPGRTARTMVKKVLLDQLVCSPAYLMLLMVSLGVLEGQTLSQLKTEIKNKGAVLYLGEWVVWPPAQVVNFYFLPLKYRVVYDNSICLLYDIFWSYVWYDMDNYDSKREGKSEQTILNSEGAGGKFICSMKLDNDLIHYTF